MFDSPYRRVAVAIDGSLAAEAAIQLAFTILAAVGVAFITQRIVTRRLRTT